MSGTCYSASYVSQRRHIIIIIIIIIIVVVVRVLCVVCVAQPVMRRVVHDGEGHLTASDDDVDVAWHQGPAGPGAVLHAAPGRAPGRVRGAVRGDAGGGVSTVRFQELYSRSARHLVRMTASRVDALGNHTSPFGTCRLPDSSFPLIAFLHSRRSVRRGSGSPAV